MSTPALSWAASAACTLPTEEVPLRVAEFRRLFADSFMSAERPSPTSARLILLGGPGLLARTVELTRREAACCSFFEFTVTPVDDGSVVLAIEVPVARVAVLDGLVAHAEGSR